MLDQLGWRTLEQHGANKKLTMVYKIIQGHVAVIPGTYLQPVARPTRHSHQFGFIQYSTRKDHFRLSFFPHTIMQWNRLPLCVVQAPKVEAFKSHISLVDHRRIA